VAAQLEKRVKSRFSHRRALLLELPAEEFAHEDKGVPALLRALLRLLVSCCAAALLRSARECAVLVMHGVGPRCCTAALGLIACCARHA
jgi:hypothetical protein